MVRDGISRYDDTISVDDLRDEIDDLEGQAEDGELDEDGRERLDMLSELLSEADNYGCDYLVNDSYFEEYVQDLLEDCGDIPRDLPHYIVIDWDATAKNIQMDYTAFEFDGATFWGR